LSDKREEGDDESLLSWRRNLYVIWFAEFVAIVGFSVVVPILPLYVRRLGVQNETQVRLWSGLVFSAHAVTMAVMAPVWGILGDRYGRKLMVERAMLGGAVVMALMGMAQSVQQLALLRALQGMLTGTIAAATALVATTAPRAYAGYAMGSLQMAIYVGVAVGPLMGGAVTDAFGYRVAFMLTGTLLLLAGLAVLILVREPIKDQRSREPSDVTGTTSKASLYSRARSILSPVLGSAGILGLFGVRLMVRLAFRVPTPTLPLFVEMLGAPGAPVATVTGLTTGFRALGGAVGGRRLGELSDRIGYRSILILCIVGSASFYLPQSFVDRPVWLVILQGGAGLAMGGILASLSAALATLAPEGREGVVYGVDSSVVSVADAIGPMVGSLVAAYLGLRMPFVVAAAVFVLAGVVAIRLAPRTKARHADDSCRP
jgi:DHA1 family multidrug resistance protein-like MFS transporter